MDYCTSISGWLPARLSASSVVLQSMKAHCLDKFTCLALGRVGPHTRSNNVVETESQPRNSFSLQRGNGLLGGPKLCGDFSSHLTAVGLWPGTWATEVEPPLELSQGRQRTLLCHSGHKQKKLVIPTSQDSAWKTWRSTPLGQPFFFLFAVITEENYNHKNVQFRKKGATLVSFA